jgi:hypothetical protein
MNGQGRAAGRDVPRHAAILVFDARRERLIEVERDDQLALLQTRALALVAERIRIEPDLLR